MLENAPCVYVLTLTTDNERKSYVGRTGTSNNTGISTPYKRLGSHLAKIGNTRSCIHDNDFPDGFLEKATTTFLAVTVPPNLHVHAERWMRWKFGTQELLNRDKAPLHEPILPSEIRKKLERLYQTATKK